jgi:hypothetical protein
VSEPPRPVSSSNVLGFLTGSPEGKPARFRISRPCYDKLRRCPGWAGGGIRYARVRRCDNGFLSTYTSKGSKPLWKWRVYRCPKCRVYVLPYLIRWLDYGWWKWEIADWRRDLAHWLENRKR